MVKQTSHDASRGRVEFFVPQHVFFISRARSGGVTDRRGLVDRRKIKLLNDMRAPVAEKSGGIIGAKSTRGQGSYVNLSADATC